MLLLAFDTSTPAVTVALHDGHGVLASYTEAGANRQGELLAPGIAHVLRDARVTRAELTAVAVGTGPGPFTGLRVGLVTARALGDALGVPVHGVCSLDVLAAGVAGPKGMEGTGSTEDTEDTKDMKDPAHPDGLVVATDARRREVYWARYSGGRRLEGPAVGRPDDVATHLAAEGFRGRVIGQGAQLYDVRFAAAGLAVDAAAPAYPDAAVLAALAVRHLAAGCAPADPAPLYLRRPDAVPPGARKQVTPA